MLGAFHPTLKSIRRRVDDTLKISNSAIRGCFSARSNVSPPPHAGAGAHQPCVTAARGSGQPQPAPAPTVLGLIPCLYPRQGLIGSREGLDEMCTLWTLDELYTLWTHRYITPVLELASQERLITVIGAALYSESAITSRNDINTSSSQSHKTCLEIKSSINSPIMLRMLVALVQELCKNSLVEEDHILCSPGLVTHMRCRRSPTVPAVLRAHSLGRPTAHRRPPPARDRSNTRSGGRTLVPRPCLSVPAPICAVQRATPFSVAARY